MAGEKLIHYWRGLVRPHGDTLKLIKWCIPAPGVRYPV